MTIIQRPKRITTQGVSEESQEAVSNIGNSINQFIEESYTAIMGGLTVTDNLDQRFIQVKAKVDANGIPTILVSFKSDLISKVTGIVCVRAFGTSYVNSMPFVSFIQNGNIITVKHITGLVADTEYTLVLLVLGA